MIGIDLEPHLGISRWPASIDNPRRLEAMSSSPDVLTLSGLAAQSQIINILSDHRRGPSAHGPQFLSEEKELPREEYTPTAKEDP